MKFPKIEDNIPIPPKRSVIIARRSVVNFLRSLKVGQSFLSNNGAGYFMSNATRIGIELTCRKQEDGKTRYWRIK